MADKDELEAKVNKRTRLSRFMVPHGSHRWFSQSIAIGAVVTGAFLGATSWLFHHEVLATIGFDVGSLDPAVMEQFNRLTVVSTAVVFLTSALYMTVVAGFLFHRVAGPIYSLSEHMKCVLRGEQVGELEFRKTDQLNDLKQLYNQLLYELEVLDKPLEPTPAPEDSKSSEVAPS